MFKTIRGQATLLLGLPLAVCLGLTWFLALRDTRVYLEDNVRRQLSNLTGAAEIMVRTSNGSAGDLDRIIRDWSKAAAVRVTLVAKDGRVLLDSEVPREDISKMENHLSRPEIRQAFLTGEGFMTRRSDTTGAEYLYEARRVDLAEPMVVRVSMRMDIFEGTLSSLRRRLWATFAVAFGAAGTLGVFWMRRITDPILQITRGADAAEAGEEPRFPTDGPRELRRLSLSLKRMYRRLNRALEELTAERENLKSLVELMPAGVILLGKDRRVLYCNKPMGDLVRSGGCQGLPLEGVLRHPELIEMAEELVKGARSVETTLGVSTPWGDKWYLVRGASAGDLAVLTAQDISERVRMEDALRNFVADVGHEFQTPLTSIRGAAELLMQGASDDDAKFLRRILEQQERLSDMVDRLLMLARYEGGFSSPVEEIDLSEGIRQVAEELSWLPCGNAVEVRLQIPDKAPVRCGRDVLMAVRNLVENAIKYTAQKFPHGGGVVRIELEDLLDRWAMRVEDNGPGIPKGMEEAIFQRFRRGDFHRSRGEGHGGYGLGLAIARGIARACGGDVTLEMSHPGEGSIFRLELPKSK